MTTGKGERKNQIKRSNKGKEKIDCGIELHAMAKRSWEGVNSCQRKRRRKFDSERVSTSGSAR